MGRPLTAGERAALVAGRFYGPPPSSSLARYEATVRAGEAERDALRERVERLRGAIAEELPWIRAVGLVESVQRLSRASLEAGE